MPMGAKQQDRGSKCFYDGLTSTYLKIHCGLSLGLLGLVRSRRGTVRSYSRGRRGKCTATVDEGGFGGDLSNGIERAGLRGSGQPSLNAGSGRKPSGRSGGSDLARCLLARRAGHAALETSNDGINIVLLVAPRARDAMPGGSGLWLGHNDNGF